jgi:hypothetical protein
MEIVENLYRTARVQNDSINSADNSDHACAIPYAPAVMLARSSATRRTASVKASIAIDRAAAVAQRRGRRQQAAHPKRRPSIEPVPGAAKQRSVRKPS